jgi:hypothetical protein
LERNAPTAGDENVTPPGPVTRTRGAPAEEWAANATCGSRAGTRTVLAAAARTLAGTAVVRNGVRSQPVNIVGSGPPQR